MLAQPAPCLLLDLEAEPFGYALLDPADQDGGGVGAGHVDRLVRSKQGDAGEGQFFFELQCVVGVAAGALDVLADHRGEPGRRPGSLGQQVSQPAVTGDADVRELLVRAAVPALVDGQPAGLDVPEVAGDEKPGRQLGL